MRGVSAKDHLTESIREPEAFVAEGVEGAIPGLITAAMTASLSGDDVAALVEFLLPENIAWPEELVPAVTQGIHEKGVLSLQVGRMGELNQSQGEIYMERCADAADFTLVLV